MKQNKRFEFDKNRNTFGGYIIGTDEAGRGPGAGPVFASAVCFTNLTDELIEKLCELNDSKQLNEKTREKLYEIIIRNSVYSIKQGSVEEIEKNNILKASLNTMKAACTEVIEKLESVNVLVLVDGNKKIIDFKHNQEAIIKGDGQSASIGAASILAKTARDRFMKELDKEFPMYGWAKNKGYMTKAHIDGVKKYGFTKWHRLKFFSKIDLINSI